MKLKFCKGDLKADLHRFLVCRVKDDFKFLRSPQNRSIYIRESLSFYWSHMKERNGGRYKMSDCVIDKYELIRSIQRSAGVEAGSGVEEVGNGLTAFAMPHRTWYLRERTIRGTRYQVLWLSWWNGPSEERATGGPFGGLLATDRMPQMVTEMDSEMDSIVSTVSEVITEVSQENMIEKIRRITESAGKGLQNGRYILET